MSLDLQGFGLDISLKASIVNFVVVLEKKLEDHLLRYFTLDQIGAALPSPEPLS